MVSVVARVNGFVRPHYDMLFDIFIMGSLAVVVVGLAQWSINTLNATQRSIAKKSLTQQGFVVIGMSPAARNAVLANDNCTVNVNLSFVDGRWVATLANGGGEQSQPLTPTTLPRCK
jgi:hypothetical protein